MAKKRKQEASPLDEAERTIYSCFCSAANMLSQLYTQSMAQQKIAFHAGERYSLENLYHWILRQHEEGARITVSDIAAYIQNELNHGEATSVPQRMQVPNQSPQPNIQCTNLSLQVSPGLHGGQATGDASRTAHHDEAKNTIFSNALSSPVRRSLQPFHIAQAGGYFSNAALPTGSGSALPEDDFSNQNRAPSSPSSNDATDMHQDSPAHESY